ncbi:MAG: ankyrin repeat domain-containing protein [Proteobacteria bacterium]|nr:ankyrin repeat domain-containing protein [Pseudomonadota bacterium]MBU1611838.1 ankyrin repeat domain-containing protein [Pseudomonadota bacterium]
MRLTIPFLTLVLGTLCPLILFAGQSAVPTASALPEMAQFESLGQDVVRNSRDLPLRLDNSQGHRSCTPLFLCIARNDLSGAKHFTPAASALDALDTNSGATALTWAVQTATPSIVGWLLDLGANIEAPDGQRSTALATAARNGRIHTARLLLDRGADPNRATPLGIRPLQLACGRDGSLEMVRLLVEHGANPHLSDRNGWTPLAVAAKNGRTDVAVYLLELGVHPDGAPSAAYSPLHWACAEDKEQTAALLVQRGANVNSLGPKGETPLSWCRSEPLRVLLAQAGAIPASGE